MPLYEFQCKNGHRTERVIAIKDFTEEVVCQECRKHNRTETIGGTGRAVRAKLVPSITGAPKFKAGGAGGFYNPSSD